MKKIEVDLFEHVQFLSAVNCSAQGTAAFVATSVRDDRYISNLMVIKQDKPFRLTSFNESMYTWQPDNQILFASDRNPDKKDPFEERTDFYRISIKGSEAQPAFSIPMNVVRITALSAGKYLMLGRIRLDHPDYYAKSRAEKERIHKERMKESAVQIIDEQPYYQDGAGFTNGLRSQLFLYDENTALITPLFHGKENVSRYAVSADHTQLAVVVSDFTKVKTRRESLVLFDMETLEARTLIDEGTMSIHDLWFENTDHLLVAMSDMKRYGLVENSWFYSLDLETGELRCVFRNELTVGSSVGSDCQYGSGSQCVNTDRGLLMICTRNDHDELICLDKKGQMDTLYCFDGAAQCMAVFGQKVYVTAMLQQKLQELYCLDLETMTLSQITHLNEKVLDDCYVADAEKLSIPAGKYTVEGWVLKPFGYDPGQKYPAILDIHGGPKMAYGTTFFHEMQYWASQGYFVFYCNPRGSDGKDNEFAELRGLYGTIDYDDLMNFTDEVLRRYPAIDSRRLGVTGGSYGGFMTNWIIGHTDRFAAAASQRSIANWVSLICYADIGCTFDMDQVAADPWHDMNKIWDQSPLQFADKAHTPTLFIHSFEDYRCLLQEGMQMYNALVYHGVEARMCLFKGESHGLSRIGKPSNRQRRLLEITAWMDRYCKK